jgi:RNA-directed DNA polymerase
MPKSKRTQRPDLQPMTIEGVARDENLRRAFEQVATNDGAPGPDRVGVVEVREHLDFVIAAVQRALLDGDYRPGLIRRVWIPKSGGGQRGLGIPNVVDRLVQQAVHQVLAPHYEPTFHASSHGFRPERSCHTAIAEAVQYLDEGFDWVVDIDLSRFFDRVHHQRLLSKLEERIDDGRLVDLIRRMLKAKVVMPDGVIVSTDEGTPQGGPLSPLLSNIVLDELDRELTRRGLRFVRYADDCNIYVASERAGHRVMDSITRFIESRLRLEVNAEKSAVARPEERHFLGFSLGRDAATGDIDVSLSTRSKDRIDAKVRELVPRSWGRSLDDCILRLNRYLLGWLGFFRVCTEKVERVLGGLDARIRRRLRAIKLAHWKRKSVIVRQLVAHGARPHTSWGGVFQGRRRVWALSHTPIVDRTLRNAYFAKRGLVSLKERWLSYHRELAIGPMQLSLALG